MIAIIDDIIASVAPQQTVISRSGSAGPPWVRAKVRKTLRKIYSAVLQREARHFADHRFGELLGLYGQPRRANVFCGGGWLWGVHSMHRKVSDKFRHCAR